MGAVEIAREREEVVPVEEGVGAGGVDGLPGPPDLGVGGVLLLDLDSDTDSGQAMLLLTGTIRNGIIAGLAAAEDAPHLYCQDNDARARRRR
jgi:hypothetical protein